MYKWYQSRLALVFRSFNLRVDPWPLLSWNTITLLLFSPHFDGNNYAYWKVRMKAFLKSIDERFWNSIEHGWEKPTTPVGEWQTFQKEIVTFNSKAINTIFNAVSMEEFKRISNVEIANTTWNILQTVHEVTKTVKINKL